MPRPSPKALFCPTMHPDQAHRAIANPWPAVLAAIALIALWRIALAWLLPVTQDEAYYFDWARSLAWGYFDHPPGVALLGIGVELAPASALAGRLGTLIAATLTLVILARLYWRSGLRDRDDLLLALMIAFATLPGIASGLITTPDTVLGLTWALALHEAQAALTQDRRRWLSAGLAVGVGLLGKYTMALIGPVLLWAILRRDPRALASPWPWLGGLLALAVFLPHLLWNAQNDWLSLRFQFGHGFATETGELLRPSLPPPLTGEWVPMPGPSEPVGLIERATEVLAFLGTQAALWGLLALPLLAALLPRRTRAPLGDASGGTMEPSSRTLLATAALFPLVFFAPLASFSEVEANWPAMYLIAAAPFAAVALRRLRRWAYVAAAGNLLLASLYAFHAATAALPLPDGQQRVLRETHGFAELAAEAARLPGPVFADRYQTVAMLRFYQPQIRATQWPGIRRPSEYLRGVIAPEIPIEKLREGGGFWLITVEAEAPELPGFRADPPRVLLDCAGQRLHRASAGPSPCDKPLHTWRLFRYQPVNRQRRAPRAPRPPSPDPGPGSARAGMTAMSSGYPQRAR